MDRVFCNQVSLNPSIVRYFYCTISVKFSVDPVHKLRHGKATGNYKGSAQ